MGGRARAEAAYPSRPVTVVVPFPAGGSTHVVARLLADRLSRLFGQPFAVSNRAGLSGTAGSAAVARAQPDGHTLLVSPNSTFAMAAQLFQLPYDNATAFAPVSLLASNAVAICVQAESGLRSLGDLVRAARAAPGQLSYGSAGTGVISHLAAELLADGFEIRLAHVELSGVAPAMQAVVAGRVVVSFVDLATALPLIRAGALRALAVTSAARVAPLPEVPTVAESGIPGYHATADFALFAPAATPEPMLDRLAEAAMAVMRADEMRDRLAPLGIEPIGSGRAALAAYIGSEILRWREVIAANNIAPP